MVGWCVWFLIDTVRGDARVANLVLIVPGVATAVLFGLILLGSEFIDRGGTAKDEKLRPIKQPVIIIIMLFGLITVIPYIGFDISLFIFLVALTYALGEKNILKSSAYAAAFTAVLMTLMRFTADIPPPPFF
jgi:hypothetical protein